MHIAIYGRNYNESGKESLLQLLKRLTIHNATYIIEASFLKSFPDKVDLPGRIKTFSKCEPLDGRVDYLISVGGDGTMLDTVTIVRDRGIPVIGINTGKLGFLSGVSNNQIEMAINDLFAGRYRVEKRTLLRLDTEKRYFGELNYALNELSVHRKESPSLIAIQVWVDDIFVNSYWADGLIICTPTGSTGYSLSCGGPIVHPQAGSFLITPIATHNLTVRPIVIPDDKSIKIKVHNKYGNFTAGLDARYCEVYPEDELLIRKERFCFNLIQFESENFFSTIREKLKWGLDTRN